MTIRAYQPRDDDAVYDVCLRTGADGDDATELYRDPDLLGSVYVGPYLRFAPALALVAEDDEGVGGYALGVADTSTFEKECATSWWPGLRERHQFRDDASADAAIIALIHNPPVTPPELARDYPAHVHIDLLPRFQGRGYGTKMMHQLFGLLADHGATGVHLGVSPRNARAMAFYQHLGMSTQRADDDSVIMTRKLSTS